MPYYLAIGDRQWVLLAAWFPLEKERCRTAERQEKGK